MKLLKMKLQMFAEGDGNTNPPEGNSSGQAAGQDPGQAGEEGNEPQEKTFNRDDIAKIIAAEKTKWEKESAKKMEDAKSEGERLAKMSADEKAEELARQKKEEDDKRLADITRRELRLEALEILEGKNLPKELIDAVVLTDSDACKASIDGVEKAFRSAVEKAVNDRLKQSAETPAGSSTGGTLSEGEKYAKQANDAQKATAKTPWD